MGEQCFVIDNSDSMHGKQCVFSHNGQILYLEVCILPLV